MTDTEAIKQAVAAFHNLSGDDTAKLKELNAKIQNHEGKWGVVKGGEKTVNGVVQMQWVANDPLIYEFLDFMHDKSLLPMFDWVKWNEGSDLFVLKDNTKYNSIDPETILKLIYAATRKERFADGTLSWAFESGGFVELIKRLVELKDLGHKHHEQ